MRKAFKAVLPDEPYKTTTKKNITVDCIYTGRRFLLIRLNGDGTMFALERAAETEAELEPFKMTPEQLALDGDTFQIVLDAEVNTWEAAHITHDYEHGEVPNYKETLPTGEVYEYHYDDFCAALDQPFYVNDMRYDIPTQTWIRPRYRVHAVTRQDFLAGMAVQARVFKEAYDSGKYLAQDMEKFKAYYEFCQSVPTKYANVDHWKINCPAPPII